MGLKKRAAIELSMNVIVIIILSMATLGIGIWLGNKIINKGQIMSESAFSEMENSLNEIMCSDRDIVCLQPGRAKINIGKGSVFKLRINNIDQSADFRINVKLVGAYAGLNEKLIKDDEMEEANTYMIANNRWVLFDRDDFRIEANKDKMKAIYIKPDRHIYDNTPTVRGSYLFSVSIMRKNATEGYQQYGSTQKIIVDVI